MTAIGYLLLGVAGLGSLVCWVMVLIKMFQNEKPLIGILGVICSLWAFIWGWMNVAKTGQKNQGQSHNTARSDGLTFAE